MIVSNRLPVDHVSGAGEDAEWRTSPGGLVAALEPVMRERDGVWIGWPGLADQHFDPFEADGIDLIPVPLSATEVEYYYEGFSNDTLWPLYHDVISPPSFHREWWDAYQRVNRRFADAALAVAAPNAIVWVHDYQLQLVPKMLRDARPDLIVGFFNHIPFPAYGIYSQLPWRKQIVDGLLGADVVGFQRVADAGNFARAVRRLHGYETRGNLISVPLEASATRDGAHAEGAAAEPGAEAAQAAPVRHRAVGRRGHPIRTVLARPFPISIDAQEYQRLAADPKIRARAAEIRDELGNPKTVMLGVDRLDYTKGIRHRMKAFGELLEEGALSSEDVVLVQVASPSRERVDAYAQLRDEVEVMVSRVNGDFSTLGRPAIHYLHQGYPREEMVALYLAADVMLVTALRDGMNLVAKEYVASRTDQDGVLILSEFAGASDELRQALLVNPHDIDGLKAAIVHAINMPQRERMRRMRTLRKRVLTHDVQRWSATFLDALTREDHRDPANSLDIPKRNVAGANYGE